jgi:uncharacterized protein YndB with AHSA1/START domain
MPDIYHLVTIKSDTATVYAAVTTQYGLSRWWLPDTIAEPEIGFVNEFRVETKFINKMKVIALELNTKVEWECINENDEWTGTHILFDIREKDGTCYLHFKQTGWKEQTEFFANCSFHWARHLIMLKHLCETGTSILQADSERQLADSALKNL